MSGHMVGVDIENGKRFFLANIAEEQAACEAVMAATSEANATALASLDDKVFQFVGLPEGKIREFPVG